MRTCSRARALLHTEHVLLYYNSLVIYSSVSNCYLLLCTAMYGYLELCEVNIKHYNQNLDLWEKVKVTS